MLDKKVNYAVLNMDADLTSILEEMVENDVTITVRAIAKRHPNIKSASSFIRSELRMKSITEAQELQRRIRSVNQRVNKTSSQKISKMLADKDIAILDLRKRNALLVTSHVAMLQAVGEIGGFAKWRELFRDYQKARESLSEMKAIHDAETIQLSKE